MTGNDHYKEAERLLICAATRDIDGLAYFVDEDTPGLAAAQVHATLALAAATEKATAFAHGVDDGGYGR